MAIDIEDIQNHNDFYWTKNLKGMLSMTDQIMRLYGHDEKQFKERMADFMWKVVQDNLNEDTKPRHDGEVEHCGTFPKDKGSPSISHLIADAYPREGSWVDAFNREHQSDQE